MTSSTLPTNKRLLLIILAVPALLLIPAIAMQFSEEVNWGPGDFVIMGMLLLGVGLIAELIIRKVENQKARLPLLILLAILFLLTWAELAVGIFGTPFSGN